MKTGGPKRIGLYIDVFNLLSLIFNVCNYKSEDKVAHHALYPAPLSDKAHQVRRIFYPQTSPAGCGRVWEWCDNAGWKSYNMEVQYVIDDAYHNTVRILFFTH